MILDRVQKPAKRVITAEEMKFVGGLVAAIVIIGGIISVTASYGINTIKATINNENARYNVDHAFQNNMAGISAAADKEMKIHLLSNDERQQIELPLKGKDRYYPVRIKFHDTLTDSNRIPNQYDIGLKKNGLVDIKKCGFWSVNNIRIPHEDAKIFGTNQSQIDDSSFDLSSHGYGARNQHRVCVRFLATNLSETLGIFKPPVL